MTLSSPSTTSTLPTAEQLSESFAAALNERYDGVDRDPALSDWEQAKERVEREFDVELSLHMTGGAHFLLWANRESGERTPLTKPGVAIFTPERSTEGYLYTPFIPGSAVTAVYPAQAREVCFELLHQLLDRAAAAEGRAAELLANAENNVARAVGLALDLPGETSYTVAEELGVSQSWVARRDTRGTRSGRRRPSLSANKLARLRRASALAKHPRTFDAVIAELPEDLANSLTATQLAQVLDVMRAQYERGRAAGADAM